jgi:hypothetical protein
MFAPALEQNLQSKLNLAAIGGAGDAAHRCRVVDVLRRSSEEGVVEEVEEFPAEHDIGPIPRVEVAHEGHVGVHLAWRVEDVTLRIAESWIRG